MRDTLPSTGPLKNEAAVVNTDSVKYSGKHWVAFKKRGTTVIYFDSYGNLRPPLELQYYLKNCKIYYNHDVYQRAGYRCGHLCLEFLNKRFQIYLCFSVMSFTFTLTGRSNRLTADIYPPVQLDNRYEYSVALIGFHTYNSIPNIEEGCNKFHFVKSGKTQSIELPTGSYEVSDIEFYLQTILAPDLIDSQERYEVLSLKPNSNTLTCELKSKYEVDFGQKDSIAPLLGFSKRKLKKNTKHVSDKPVNIIRVTTIRLECNVISGSFYNGKPSHTLYEFSPMVDPGFAIDIEPRNLIYLPLSNHLRMIDNITIDIIDQDSEPVNFREEQVVARVELRRRLVS